LIIGRFLSVTSSRPCHLRLIIACARLYVVTTALHCATASVTANSLPLHRVERRRTGHGLLFGLYRVESTSAQINDAHISAVERASPSSGRLGVPAGNGRVWMPLRIGGALALVRHSLLPRAQIGIIVTLHTFPLPYPLFIRLPKTGHGEIFRSDVRTASAVGVNANDPIRHSADRA
jgi:hypothetical protein